MGAACCCFRAEIQPHNPDSCVIKGPATSGVDPSTLEDASKQQHERMACSRASSIAGSVYFDADDGDWQVSDNPLSLSGLDRITLHLINISSLLERHCRGLPSCGCHVCSPCFPPISHAKMWHWITTLCQCRDRSVIGNLH